MFETWINMWTIITIKDNYNLLHHVLNVFGHLHSHSLLSRSKLTLNLSRNIFSTPSLLTPYQRHTRKPPWVVFVWCQGSTSWSNVRSVSVWWTIKEQDSFARNILNNNLSWSSELTSPFLHFAWISSTLLYAVGITVEKYPIPRTVTWLKNIWRGF